MLPSLRALFGLQRPAAMMRPPGAADDLIVTDPVLVRRDLEDVAGCGRVVAWRSPDDQFIGNGLLQLGDGATIELRPLPGDHAPVPPLPPLLNATTSGRHGLLLFTLMSTRAAADGVPRAAWPGQIIRMQSRRHFRVQSLQGPTHRVQVVLPGATKPMQVRDLSEGGIGFELEATAPALPARLAGVRLWLDNELLAPTLLQVVHQHAGGAVRRAGAQFMNLGGDDARTLRRWMAAVQAAGAAQG